MTWSGREVCRALLSDPTVALEEAVGMLFLALLAVLKESETARGAPGPDPGSKLNIVRDNLKYLYDVFPSTFTVIVGSHLLRE